MEIVGVIPARFASTRLPGKALLSATGRPLIQHVIEAARRAQSLQQIIVATDDARIADAVTAIGGAVMMTRADHATGTDRVAEVAARLEGARVIVNLQGDEPEVSGDALDRVVALLETDPEAPMATLATPIRDQADLPRPRVRQGRLRPPRPRPLFLAQPDPLPSRRPARSRHGRSPVAYLHLGLYAYRREFLLKLGSLPPSPLEAAEKLEQLRVLEAGYPIAVGLVDEPSDRHRHTRRLRAIRGALAREPGAAGISCSPRANARAYLNGRFATPYDLGITDASRCAATSLRHRQAGSMR